MGILQEAKNKISNALSFPDPDRSARTVLERAKREAQEGSSVEVSLNGELYRLRETGYDTLVEPLKK